MSDDIKSAYELAMERLDQKGNEGVSLTGEQKREIAAIDQDVEVKLAVWIL